MYLGESNKLLTSGTNRLLHTDAHTRVRVTIAGEALSTIDNGAFSLIRLFDTHTSDAIVERRRVL